MLEFKESKFYKLLQDFFINNDKETFLQMLAEFYNRTEGIIIKNDAQDEIIKELRELFLKFNEEGIDENIVREKVNYFVENNEKIQDIITKIIKNKNNIENITSQMENELPLKLDKIGGKVSKTNMYGTRDNACILNVNNTNRDADVLNLSSFKGLAQYVDRDNVNIYSHSEAPMGMRLNAITFSENSVTFATGIDLSNVKIGMYIDCYNSDYYNPNDKYSGFIKEINGNVITVDGWGKYNYLVNGVVPNGQIPPSNYNFVVINGATKTWVVNYNASLVNNSLAKKAVIAEYGLFNSKSETDNNADVSGLDIVNFKGKSQFGIRIRKKSSSNGEIANGIDTAGVNYGFVNNSAEHTAFKNKSSGERGFCNDSSKTGFINMKAAEIGFQNVSAPIGFTTSGLDTEKGYRATDKNGNEYLLTSGSGKYRKLSLAKSVITSDTSLNLENNVMFYISGSRNITLPPCTHALEFRIFKIFSTGESIITSTSDIKNSGLAVKSLTLTPYKMYEMFTDGSTWFIV